MITIFTEDGYSYYTNRTECGFGLTFWNEVASTLNSLNNNNIEVKTSDGNGSFIKKLKTIYNPNDTFIIVLDRAIDNRAICTIIDSLNKYIIGKDNIIAFDSYVQVTTRLGRFR